MVPMLIMGQRKLFKSYSIISLSQDAIDNKNKLDLLRKSENNGI